jgi:hypothetical protein
MPSGGRVNCGVSTLRVLARLQHNDVLRAKVARSNRAGQARISLFNVVSGWLIGSIVINHDPAWPA